ncbi:hypothetical protein GGI24_005815, partial [Coemansia furcata]
MFARAISVLVLATIYSVAALPHQPAGTHVPLSKRCGGCGGYGGYGGYGGFGGYGRYGGFGFPFVVSATNELDANANFANFDENTLYANN